MFNKLDWEPPEEWLRIETLEMHTGGEPLRVFTAGLPQIKGSTILEKRRYFRDHLDYIRTGTMWEPRGHADMYGAVLTEPCTEGSDLGVFFMHNEGYSTMCGHAIIALTKMVLDTGMIIKDGDTPEVIFDAPPGKIIARGHREAGVVARTSFLNVPSFVLISGGLVEVPDMGKVRINVAYGGAFYALAEASDLGLELIPEAQAELVDAGRKIKKAVMDKYPVKHPFQEDLGFLYGTIFTGPPHDTSHHSRNVCIFADGELDRSATGSGVSARAALHFSMGELSPGKCITIESILGTTMDVSVREAVEYGPHQAVIPEVSGSAHFSGKNIFYFDPDDPLKEGFILR
jgi:proline racemase